MISDQKLPVEKWESESDMVMDHSKWSEVVFFLDKDRKIFRSEVHMNGRQSGVSGIFGLKINPRRAREGSPVDSTGWVAQLLGAFLLKSVRLCVSSSCPARRIWR